MSAIQDRGLGDRYSSTITKCAAPQNPKSAMGFTDQKQDPRIYIYECDVTAQGYVSVIILDNVYNVAYLLLKFVHGCLYNFRHAYITGMHLMQ